LSPNTSKQILVGCCGWSYSDPADKGGWVGAFYPTASTKKLPYYSKFFRTVEMDSTFYKRFYKYMTPSTFRGMASSSPDGFEFSVKLPETITHDKRLDISKGVMIDLEEFLEKIMPLKISRKLGVILIQLPPSFTVQEFKNTEQFLDGLPTDYEFAIEFRHPSWETEGPWDMLKHYNIATVLVDAPVNDKLGFLSDVTVTANHSFVRFHGRDPIHRYDYLYSNEELKSWASKIRKIQTQTGVVRSYFNNHYGAKAVINALQFQQILGIELNEEQKKGLANSWNCVNQLSPASKLDGYFGRDA
jgi:uncharacterized protein YecE (DUF72 family)